MNAQDMQKWMQRTFGDVQRMRDAGQQEYARADTNAFANFERVAEFVGISREQALMVYAIKHLDGICAYVNGHTSQREDVRGRITDLITYMCLLRAMVEENSIQTGDAPDE